MAAATLGGYGQRLCYGPPDRHRGAPLVRCRWVPLTRLGLGRTLGLALVSFVVIRLGDGHARSRYPAGSAAPIPLAADPARLRRGLRTAKLARHRAPRRKPYSRSEARSAVAPSAPITGTADQRALLHV